MSMLATIESELQDEDFELFRSLIWKESGISLGAKKKELVRARLLPRLRKLGYESFRQYYRYVVHDQSGGEMKLLLDAISTNLTSFFRESSHFDFLAQSVLPELVKAKQETKDRRVRVWSAACSTGEEAYCLAITLAEFFKRLPAFEVKVLGSDISGKVLAVAQQGIYHNQRLLDVPIETVKRYFQRGSGECRGSSRVKPSLAKMVNFRRHNLLDPVPFRSVDIIFCRNVLIYFDRDVQQRVLKNLLGALAPNGYLFVGHSESLAGSRNNLRYIQPAVYQRA